MPSTSKSQQQLMGAAYAVKKGDTQISNIDADYRDKVSELVDNMTLNQLKDFAETSHAGLPDRVEESFEAGKTYTWTGVEWDPKRKNNYKVSKNIEIIKVKPNGDLVGRFEGESSEFIVRQPEKTLKKIKENITVGGMGDVQLPTETEFGSGDVPAGRKNIKKKMKLKNKIATFEQFLVESLQAKESVVNEAFYRLPKDVIGTELYVANKNLQSFYSNVSTGNDVDPKVLDTIIKNLQQVKSLTKKFNKAEEITGTVYEGAGKPAGLTKDETLKVAQKFADAAASVDPKKGKWTVNKKTLEEDSFNLDINGELGEGGSYNVYQNGDVINMALRENPIIGKKDDDAKTIANGFKKMMNESVVNEARSINKIQKDWAKVTADMKDTVDEWKSAEGDNKTKLLDQLKSLTARKKQLEAELNDAVSGKDADLELVVKESLSESAMSDIDLLAQEAKDFKDFVKEFKKEYKHMDTGNPKELEAWLKGVYDAAMEDMDESKN